MLEKEREDDLQAEGHRPWWGGEGYAGPSGAGTAHPEGVLSSPQESGNSEVGLPMSPPLTFPAGVGSGKRELLVNG